MRFSLELGWLKNCTQADVSAITSLFIEFRLSKLPPIVFDGELTAQGFKSLQALLADVIPQGFIDRLGLSPLFSDFHPGLCIKHRKSLKYQKQVSH